MTTPTMAAVMVPSQTVAAPGARFPYEVRNEGTVRIGLGEPYRLERLDHAHWRPCRLPFGFRLPLYLLPPGGSRTLTASVPAEVEAGHYRLVKEIRAAEHLPPARDIPALELDFEFDVVAAG